MRDKRFPKRVTVQPNFAAASKAARVARTGCSLTTGLEAEAAFYHCKELRGALFAPDSPAGGKAESGRDKKGSEHTSLQHGRREVTGSGKGGNIKQC